MPPIDVFEPPCALEENSAAPLRLAFVIPSMMPGGAERVAATLCNQWIQLGHDVHLITFAGDDVANHYPLAPAIRLHRLDLLRSSRSLANFVYINLKRIFVLRRTLRAIAPNAVVAFMPEPNVVSVIASAGQRWPVVISERVHPAHLPLSRLPSILRYLAYPRADAVVAQTRAIADYLDATFGVSSTVIPNPIDLAQFNATGRWPSSRARHRLLSVGRLESQKGFDVLIEAFSLLSTSFPDWELIILGDGSGRAALTDQIAADGLEDRVRVAGTVFDIESEFRQADIYVHCARFEGTPNAVIEALACGCPVVATDCPGGIRDILRDGAFGRLTPVDDVPALVAALSELMADEASRAILSRQAPSAVAGLSATGIAGRWIDLVRSLRPSS
ncbi:MAG TPA: glycosyltransferase family 4 protein [Parvibaculum sp.]|jgi:glycosyltransferase involved in cell wall biosynthesis